MAQGADHLFASRQRPNHLPCEGCRCVKGRQLIVELDQGLAPPLSDKDSPPGKVWGSLHSTELLDPSDLHRIKATEVTVRHTHACPCRLASCVTPELRQPWQWTAQAGSLHGTRTLIWRLEGPAVWQAVVGQCCSNGPWRIAGDSHAFAAGGRGRHQEGDGEDRHGGQLEGCARSGRALW